MNEVYIRDKKVDSKELQGNSSERKTGRILRCKLTHFQIKLKLDEKILIMHLGLIVKKKTN